MALTPDELDRIAARTLAHYDEQARSYWNGTRDHDVSQNVDALLRHIEAPQPFLGELHAALKPGGVLFCSNPRGQGQEGWSGDRYGAFHDGEAWRGHVAAAGFTELAHFYRPPGLPPEQQPWLASVWRKPVP